uniref:Uncharacterized protein n=1 Tax=Oryza punctata TaxID=4537 RepID=A0A0E0K3H1_ORYPU
MVRGPKVVVFVVNGERYELRCDNGAVAGDPGALGFLRSRARFTSAKLHYAMFHRCAVIGVGHSMDSPLPPTSSLLLYQSLPYTSVDKGRVDMEETVDALHELSALTR